MELETVWPLFGLVIETPRLVLRPVRDQDLPQLSSAALDGVHDHGRTPFTTAWTEAPAAELPSNLARFHWNLRARLNPDDWTIAFAVHHEGRVIGAQDLGASDFAGRRTVETGSWITRSVQGQGLGTEMRAGVLSFAFDMLEAEWAESSAATWNTSSLRVSEKLGYQANGISKISPRGGQPSDSQRVRLSKDEFIRPSWSIVVQGASPALAQLGIADTRAPE